MLRTSGNDNIVVSALHACSNFGRLLRRVEDEHRSLVIEKRGTPRAVLLSIRHYARLAAPPNRKYSTDGKIPSAAAPTSPDHPRLIGSSSALAQKIEAPFDL
jgi:prevent-host-death family protein